MRATAFGFRCGRTERSPCGARRRIPAAGSPRTAARQRRKPPSIAGGAGGRLPPGCWASVGHQGETPWAAEGGLLREGNRSPPPGRVAAGGIGLRLHETRDGRDGTSRTHGQAARTALGAPVTVAAALDAQIQVPVCAAPPTAPTCRRRVSAPPVPAADSTPTAGGAAGEGGQPSGARRVQTRAPELPRGSGN